MRGEAYIQDFTVFLQGLRFLKMCLKITVLPTENMISESSTRIL